MQNPRPTPYGRRVSWGVKDWDHSRIQAFQEVLLSRPTTPRNSTLFRISERSYDASILTTRPMSCLADSSPNLEPTPEAGAAPPALQIRSGGRSTTSTSKGGRCSFVQKVWNSDVNAVECCLARSKRISLWSNEAGWCGGHGAGATSARNATTPTAKSPTPSGCHGTMGPRSCTGSCPAMHRVETESA